MIGLKCGRIVLEDRLLDGFVYIQGDRICAVCEDALPCEEIYDFTGGILAPGFVDIHTHGAGGCSFSNSSPEAVLTACHTHLRHGTTTIFPTISTAAIGDMERSLRNIAAARKMPELRNRVPGVHMEGPYLSPKQCGAQNSSNITPPVKEDYVNLVEQYPREIARWTYAPEQDPEGTFCAFLMENGILPSVGHSDATYEQLAPAVDAGCKLVTHLYSATSTVTRQLGYRQLGVIETAYLRDDIAVEIIADGHHLPPELSRMIVKIKGVDRVAAVTDSLYPAGTDLKEGCTDGVSFLVEGGVCRLPDRSAFAGSIATADRLLQVLHRDCGIELTQAVKMLTAVPARIMGLDVGLIAQGKPADLVLLDENLQAQAVFVGGKKVS